MRYDYVLKYDYQNQLSRGSFHFPRTRIHLPVERIFSVTKWALPPICEKGALVFWLFVFLTFCISSGNADICIKKTAVDRKSWSGFYRVRFKTTVFSLNKIWQIDYDGDIMHADSWTKISKLIMVLMIWQRWYIISYMQSKSLVKSKNGVDFSNCGNDSI